MIKYLIVANRSMGGRRLEEHLREIVRQRGHVAFHLMVPERGLEIYEVMWGAELGLPVAVPSLADDRHNATQERLDEVLARLQSKGVDITGELGPAPPMAAIVSAMKDQRYDEILISVLPHKVSDWLRMDLPRRVTRKFGIPVSTIMHDGDDSAMIVGPERATFTDYAVTDGDTTIRGITRNQPIQVLVVNAGSEIGRRARVALENTGLCAVNTTMTLGEAEEYLNREGGLAGRVKPDLVVVPAQIGSLGGAFKRAGTPLLVVSDTESIGARQVAESLDAWAFVVLSEDAVVHTNLLEPMLVDLMAHERRSAVIDPQI